MNKLVKEFDKEDKFGGSYEDYLELDIRSFKSLTKICQMPNHELPKAMPIMMKGDALDFLDDYQESCKTFDEALIMLWKW